MILNHTPPSSICATIKSIFLLVKISFKRAIMSPLAPAVEMEGFFSACAARFFFKELIVNEEHASGQSMSGGSMSTRYIDCKSTSSAQPPKTSITVEKVTGETTPTINIVFTSIWDFNVNISALVEDGVGKDP